MSAEATNYKRKRNLSEDTFSDEYEEIICDLAQLNFSSNNKMLTEIYKKISILEKKMDHFDKINIKIEALQKNIDKIFVEKDYVIDSLKDEIKGLRDEIKYSGANKSHDNSSYFY